jgi:hypothetical protein
MSLFVSVLKAPRFQVPSYSCGLTSPFRDVWSSPADQLIGELGCTDLLGSVLTWHVTVLAARATSRPLPGKTVRAP